MATLQHALVTDPDIHEVKGVSAAAPGYLLVADGVGSADWVTPADAINTAYARVLLANNVVPITIPAAVDGTLHTPGDYTALNQLYTTDFTLGITFVPVTNEFQINLDGIYRIDFWASLSTTGTDNTTALSTMLNGVATADLKPVLKAKLKTAGDIVTLSGFGMAEFSNGDTFSIAAADDIGIDLTIHESICSLELIRVT
jgi:hypothetical protein